MRLHERGQREVTVFPWTGMEEDVYTWGDGFAIRAAVYPAGERLVHAVYGETAEDRRVLLYGGDAKLCVGMGVSLDGGAPTHRIARLERWSHVRAELESIPERRRAHVI